jgi:hypothetical protein
MSNWWETAAYASKQAAGRARMAPPGGDNNGSANAAEYRLGLTKPAARPSSDNSGYQSSNSYTGMPAPKEVDYQELARQIYEPSLDYLDSQSAAAKKRNAANDSQLAAMFGAGVKDIRGQAGGIKKNYKDIIGQVAQGTGAAVGAVDRTYDASANELAQMLQHLGIQAAAPDALAQNTRDESFFKNMASASGKSVADMLQANEASSLDFNTAQGNITRQSGLDARANNKLNLEDTLNQIMGQRSGLETQINQQAQSMQSSATDQLLKQMEAAQQQANKGRELDISQGNLMLNTSKFQASSAKDAANKKDPNPWASVSQLADQLYPGGNAQHGSGPAVQAIMDTVSRYNGFTGPGHQPASEMEFIRAVLERNKGAGDANQLQQLAAVAYKNLFGK